MQLAGHKSRTDKHPKHRGVDGMPHELIWTGLDQLVLELDGDLSAPIRTKMSPSPYAQHPGRRLDTKTGPNEERCVWQESLR